MNNLSVIQKRVIFTEYTTISNVFIHNHLVCHFLEDKDRGLANWMELQEVEDIKIKTETCIGYGEYNINITLSQRFGYWLPLVTLVKGFSGIRQHIGNTNKDTEGCQLPFTTIINNDNGGGSTIAFYTLFEIYLFHLIEKIDIVTKLIELHKLKRSGAKEFGELFIENLNRNNTITIEITKS
jgi:hypothetical protein